MSQGNKAASHPSSSENAHAQEFLTFTLGTEEYAIDILSVQEIRGYDPVTAIAHAPPSSKVWSIYAV